jgi:quinolinate synthase
VPDKDQFHAVLTERRRRLAAGELACELATLAQQDHGHEVLLEEAASLAGDGTKLRPFARNEPAEDPVVFAGVHILALD